MDFYSGFKHQLAEDVWFQTSIYPKDDVKTPLIELYTTGLLCVKKHYAWDGASGPVVDRKSNYSASCAHDALYELLRKRKLPRGFWELADAEYIRILRDKGKAFRFTVWMDAKGLAIAGGKYSKPKHLRILKRAP
jgi:hypothetical protein